jgi:PKHD-type hydroxylase
MTQNYIKRKLLDDQSLEKIKELLVQCTWQDGLYSAPGLTHDRKNNLEAEPTEISEKINDIVMNSLDRDLTFFHYCVPDTSNRVIISKTSNGGFYNVHHDKATNGHYSTTVFLSDPDDYEGGELCLYIDGREKVFKPVAGTAVTYNTGLLHKVNKVTSGVRYAAVFWTKSIFDDPFIREIYSDIERVVMTMPKPQNHDNFKNALEDNRFVLEEVLNKLTRKFLKQIK